MVHHPADMPVEKRPHMRGGEGIIALQAAFSPRDHASPVRLFSRITIPAGGSIGYHIHEQEAEFFYVLSGEGMMDDNGSIDLLCRSVRPQTIHGFENQCALDRASLQSATLTNKNYYH